MAFELMQDAGLPKPKSRAEGKTICYFNSTSDI